MIHPPAKSGILGNYARVTAIGFCKGMMMTPDRPVTSAQIPSFLLFDVGAPTLSMGTVHGDYAVLDRDYSAPLKARTGQPLVSAAGFLDAIAGTLVVGEAPERAEGWSGFIQRTKPRQEEAGFRTTDYRVVIEMAKPGFAEFLQMVQAGLPLTTLVLNFQNIDCPIIDDPMDGPIAWDDVATPTVSLTSFRLDWGAAR
jgi:hypothetical protein